MKYGITAQSAGGKRAAKSKEANARRVKVLIALRGMNGAAAQGVAASSHATANTAQYAANRAAYGSTKQVAKSKQKELITWLEGEKAKVPGGASIRKASAPTAFGTFTLEVTETLIPILERSPLVESVVRVEDTPMVLLDAAAGAPSAE